MNCNTISTFVFSEYSNAPRRSGNNSAVLVHIISVNDIAGACPQYIRIIQLAVKQSVIIIGNSEQVFEQTSVGAEQGNGLLILPVRYDIAVEENRIADEQFLQLMKGKWYLGQFPADKIRSGAEQFYPAY